MVKDIRIEEFDYPLPPERIASHPLQERDACRLLVSPPEGEPFEKRFSSLPELLPAGSLLVANDAKVINARIIFHKESGSKIEIFLLEPAAPADYALNFQAHDGVVWKCLVGNLKRWKDAPLVKELEVGGRSVALTAEKAGADAEGHPLVRLSWSDASIPFSDVLAAAGFIPIPPYLNRSSQDSDNSDYQTVYSAVQGSVAAPTAGLHFTPGLADALDRAGIARRFLTLHVGAGTFRPVKSETIGGHEMHSESFSVSRALLVELRDAVGSGRPVVAVGTTSVRTLESLPYFGRLAMRGQDVSCLPQWTPYDDPLDPSETAAMLSALIGYMDKNGLDDFSAHTSIILAPGAPWLAVDAMITNFHQPGSTLLLLVASFLEQGAESPEMWRSLYDFALREGFRFLSYGDACLLFPRRSSCSSSL